MQLEDCFVKQFLLESRTILRAVPSDILWLTTATRSKTIPLVLLGIPSPVVLALLQTRGITFQRGHGKHDPVVADSAVVDDTTERSLVPALLCLFTLRIYSVHHDIAGALVSVLASLVLIFH